MQKLMCESHTVKIWMCGDLQEARKTIREWCLHKGACVTLTPCEYIYTGGLESGFVVTFINYPRFPEALYVTLEKAEELAHLLMCACNQQSYTIQSDLATYFFSRRDEITEKTQLEKRDKTKGNVPV